MPSLVQGDGHGQEQQEELQEQKHNRSSNAHGCLKGSLVGSTFFGLLWWKLEVPFLVLVVGGISGVPPLPSCMVESHGTIFCTGGGFHNKSHGEPATRRGQPRGHEMASGEGGACWSPWCSCGQGSIRAASGTILGLPGTRNLKKKGDFTDFLRIYGF